MLSYKRYGDEYHVSNVTGAIALDELRKRVTDAAHKLSPAQYQIAVYILNRPQDFALLPVREVASRTGTSTATIARTAQALGFSGYAELQAEMQRVIWSQRFTMRFSVACRDGNGRSKPTLLDLMQDDIEAIRTTMAAVNLENVNSVVAILSRARQILVLGQRMSSGPAELFGRVSTTLVGKTRVLGREPGMLLHELAEISAEDALVVIGFPRYTSSTVGFAREAKRRGAQVIAVTDSSLSPLAQCSDWSFFVASASTGPVDTYVAAAAFLNALAGLVALENLDAVSARLKQLDALLRDGETFGGLR